MESSEYQPTFGLEELNFAEAGFDDSDDDDVHPLEPKYNESGKSIKTCLKKSESQHVSSFYGEDHSKSRTWKSRVPLNNNSSSQGDFNQKQKQLLGHSKQIIKQSTIKEFGMPEDSFEPIFGLRMINPLITPSFLKEKLNGRPLIPFSRLKNHVEHGDLSTDWIIAGVIVSKTSSRISKKGSNFCLWKISDLKLGLKMASLFLFGSAHTALWKRNVGTAIAVLNPSVLESKKESNDEAVLSVNNPDQVMVCGQSKDFGFCKGRKKNGENCTVFVNKSSCEFCVFHVQKEYKKFSHGRSDLQSPTGGGLQKLKNKVLGKNEVFYGGQSFTAVKPVKAVKSKKSLAKDKKTLMNLFGYMNEGLVKTSPPSSSNVTSSGKVDLKYSRIQKIKDAERLKMLCGNDETFIPKNKEMVQLRIKSDSIKPEVSKSKTVLKEHNKINVSKKDSEKSDSLKELNEFSAEKQNTSTFKMDKNDLNSSKNYNNEDSFLNEETNRQTDSTPCESKQCKNNTSSINSLNKQTNVDYKSQGSSCTITSSSGFSRKSLGEYFKTPNPKPTMIDSVLLEKPSISPSLLNKLPKKSDNTKNRSQSINNNDVVSEKSSSGFESRYLTKSSEAPGSLTLDHLGKSGEKQLIDLPIVITRRDRELAKKNALKFVKKFGPIQKVDPNNTKRTNTKTGKKRSISELNKLVEDKKDNTENEEQQSVLSERFVELMNKSSKHDDLLQEADNTFMDEYFQKMSKKEDMEEKMLTTYKIPCKAVKCLKCKYTWFSASDLCKEEGHPIKVINSLKRFFKCNDCGNRTVSLEVIPLINCKQCGKANWKRAPMLSERKTLANMNQLSIRGGEQKFINSVETNGSLNLLVPDQFDEVKLS
ncbi:protein MCM10 homolog [Lycorma delicatula]|uniref:protein MCM10 homolog n=1 Tax=Lycorma delicatula TaxID=130591 RepID=UPI003F50E01F